MAPTEYVEERGGGYYVAGSRVSLASVIFGFREGASPEAIRQNFPSLSPAQVYGAIAFYLSHPDESETYLQRLADKWNELEQGGNSARRSCKRSSQARARVCSPGIDDSASACGCGSQWFNCLRRDSPKPGIRLQACCRSKGYLGRAA